MRQRIIEELRTIEKKGKRAHPVGFYSTENTRRTLVKSPGANTPQALTSYL